MYTCEMSFIKYLLFLFNLLFAASGLAIIVAGALVLSDVSNVQRFMANELLAPAIILIVVGAVVFIVAFLGCFGAIRESYKILIAFAVCLLIIFILELAVGIVVAVYKNDFGVALKSAMKNSMANYTESKTEETAWNRLQLELQCCGVDGPSDWDAIPLRCCHKIDELHNNLSQYCLERSAGKYMFEIGCYKQLTKIINDNTNILIGVGIGIAFVEIIGIVLSCLLAQSIKNQDIQK